jgi:hypothetical protein
MLLQLYCMDFGANLVSTRGFAASGISRSNQVPVTDYVTVDAGISYSKISTHTVYIIREVLENP